MIPLSTLTMARLQGRSLEADLVALFWWLPAFAALAVFLGWVI